MEDDLPGISAQLLMSPSGRSDHLESPVHYKEACVLVLIFPKDGEWNLAFIERAEQNANDPHSGQISFPGGKLEETDDTYADCALRETQEEIGVDSSSIGIIGELTSLYISVSNYLIFPFVGFTSQEPDFVPQESEVRSILEIPLKEVFSHRNKKRVDLTVRQNKLKDVPCYMLDDHILWGASAMILSEFEAVLDEII